MSIFLYTLDIIREVIIVTDLIGRKFVLFTRPSRKQGSLIRAFLLRMCFWEGPAEIAFFVDSSCTPAIHKALFDLVVCKLVTNLSKKTWCVRYTYTCRSQTAWLSSAT